MNKKQLEQWEKICLKSGLNNAMVDIEMIEQFITEFPKVEYKRGFQDGSNLTGRIAKKENACNLKQRRNK